MLRAADLAGRGLPEAGRIGRRVWLLPVVAGLGLLAHLLVPRAAVGESRASFRVGVTVQHPGCAIVTPREGEAGRLQCSAPVPVVVTAARDSAAELVVIGPVVRVLLLPSGPAPAVVTITY